MADAITILDAYTHNLKHISLTIPRNALVVFTGVSGSGKSTLAFDTLFAEGQRRYMERLSAYAKQYMQPFTKPDVTAIEGLSPTIAIDQKTTQGNPRSTVGTLTEIADYLRLLYARIGVAHCPVCAAQVQAQTPSQVIEKLENAVDDFPDRAKVQLFSPMVRGRKGVYTELFARLRKQGFSRVRIDGEEKLLEDLPEDYRLSRQHTHDIDVVMDRVVLKRGDSGALEDDQRQRLAMAVDKAMKAADGYVRVQNMGGAEWFCSRMLACPNGHELQGQEEMAPRLFSFNSPYGACPACGGLGIYWDVDETRLVDDPSKNLIGKSKYEGGIPKDVAMVVLQKFLGRYATPFITDVCDSLGVAPDTPWKKWPKKAQQFFIHGSDGNNTHNFSDAAGYAEGFDGVIPWLRQKYDEGTPSAQRFIQHLMRPITCPDCSGQRLKPLPLSVSIGGNNIAEFSQLTVNAALTWVRELLPTLSANHRTIGQQALASVEKRLLFLQEVGLGYLTLDRRASTLSGGESQRIRLASQLGSGLSGVLYVLDEPSIGLHPHNTQQLIETLKGLRDKGNSVLVVEHDEDTIRAADWLVDIGPAAGKHGGAIVAEGPVTELLNKPSKKILKESSTLGYLTGSKQINLPAQRRQPSGDKNTGWLTLADCNRHNLKNQTVSFPLGCLITVTGLSGSGKSTLMFDLLFPALQHALKDLTIAPEGCGTLTGADELYTVVEMDQSPIGRTSRSMPATYLGVMDDIRLVFSATELAQMYGYGPGFFSFNSVKGGRCANCKGSGTIKLEMGLLPDAKQTCEVCLGRRYGAEALAVTYDGLSIADVLELTVDEAVEFFDTQPKIKRQLGLLQEVGLGYLHLGQAAPTLSGGEAQRLKLASEFVKRRGGNTVYLLDEPTVGLHWQDVDHLLALLNRLVDKGHTVMVIEHHLDVVAASDWVIDLGPGAGKDGGRVVAEGPPSVIAEEPLSLTGRYLKPLLKL